jgi:hypothetical protein
MTSLQPLETDSNAVVRSGSRPLELTPRNVAAVAPEAVALATLFDDRQWDDALAGVRTLCDRLHIPIDHAVIPAELARGGTVGRIGVPQLAQSVMRRQRVMLSATAGAEPLTPVPRLWRGLQRRADVLVDLRQRTTLPGSASARAGVRRDVLLLSQRIVERNGRTHGRTDENADQWNRARQAAEMAYRLATKEQRELLLVLPVGRTTSTQQLFADALERHARQVRVRPPRGIKAGLLSALLTGDHGATRWLVASVMSMDELCATVDEAVGDTGPWPVISVGRDVAFYDMPALETGASGVMALLLVFVNLLQRSGRNDIAQTLMQAVLVTAEAQWNMRDDDERPLPVPVTAFLDGVSANWGRSPLIAAPGRADARQHLIESATQMQGLRLRIETTLSAAEVRDAISAAVMPVGLEVASVRSVEGMLVPGISLYDVRVRSRLGEPALSDGAAIGIVRAMSTPLRCVAVDPWNSTMAGVLRTRSAVGGD